MNRSLGAGIQVMTNSVVTIVMVAQTGVGGTSSKRGCRGTISCHLINAIDPGALHSPGTDWITHSLLRPYSAPLFVIRDPCIYDDYYPAVTSSRGALCMSLLATHAVCHLH